MQREWHILGEGEVLLYTQQHLLCVSCTVVHLSTRPRHTHPLGVQNTGVQNTVFQYRCSIDGIRPGMVSPRKHLVMSAHFPSCPSTPGDWVLRCLTGERAGMVGDLLPCPRPPPSPASSTPEISRVRERNPALHHVLSHPVTLSLPVHRCMPHHRKVIFVLLQLNVLRAE